MPEGVCGFKREQILREFHNGLQNLYVVFNTSYGNHVSAGEMDEVLRMF